MLALAVGSEGGRPLLWQTAPAVPSARLGEVHVWRLPREALARALDEGGSVSSAAEKAQSKRIRRPKARTEQLAGWEFLREVLSRYLAIPPQELVFDFGPRGKPSLTQDQNHDALRFSLSHSRGTLLVAVARGREVGVDVETIRPERPHLALAQRFFSALEAEAFSALPVRVRPFAFASAWTRKEAYLKATGEGISLRALRETEVTFAPGEPARLLSTPNGRADAARWALVPLYPGQGTVGALCTEEPVRSLALFDGVRGERTT